jgi:hypothetical protein
MSLYSAYFGLVAVVILLAFAPKIISAAFEILEPYFTIQWAGVALVIAAFYAVLAYNF